MDNIAHVRVISDNELAREGIKRIISEVGTAASCASCADMLSAGEPADTPDYVYLVESDREGEGLDVCFRLREQLNHAKIVVMCPDFTIQSVRQGFERGINGFLNRKIGYSALMCKLALVVTGEKILPVAHVEAMLNFAPVTARAIPEDLVATTNLSEREIGILQCLINGDANKMISRRLNIAEPTVKVHVKSILRKLQLSNRTQAAIWAINQRIGTPLSESSSGAINGPGAGAGNVTPLHAVS